MSVTIPLSTEVEAKLRERAAAAAGKDVGDFIRQAVEEKLALSSPKEMTDAQWAAEFNAWMKEVAARAGNRPPGFEADDSRDTIHEGRGE